MRLIEPFLTLFMQCSKLTIGKIERNVFLLFVDLAAECVESALMSTTRNHAMKGKTSLTKLDGFSFGLLSKGEVTEQ